MADLMPNYGVEPPTSTGYPQTEVEFLNAIWQALGGGSSGGADAGSQGVISVNGNAYAYDYQLLTYYGTTDNVQSITYRAGGAGGSIVAVQRFNYVNGGSANGDNVSVIATTTS